MPELLSLKILSLINISLMYPNVSSEVINYVFLILVNLIFFGSHAHAYA